jgi:Fe-S cluster biogenesis protein NfuA
MGASKERIYKIGELVRRAETLPDREARSLCAELVQAVMEFHAAGLERMLSIVLQQESGPALLASFAGDDLAANLLLLHGLHPDDLRTRLEKALAKMQPFLRARGASAVLLGLDNGVVRVRVEGGQLGLQSVIREAIYSAAPEVAEVVVDGAARPASPNFVPLASLLAG